LTVQAQSCSLPASLNAVEPASPALTPGKTPRRCTGDGDAQARGCLASHQRPTPYTEPASPAINQGKRGSCDGSTHRARLNPGMGTVLVTSAHFCPPISPAQFREPGSTQHPPGLNWAMPVIGARSPLPARLNWAMPLSPTPQAAPRPSPQGLTDCELSYEGRHPYPCLPTQAQPYPPFSPPPSSEGSPRPPSPPPHRIAHCLWPCLPTQARTRAALTTCLNRLRFGPGLPPGASDAVSDHRRTELGLGTIGPPRK
jgi:hypothetical protein